MGPASSSANCALGAVNALSASSTTAAQWCPSPSSFNCNHTYQQVSRQLGF
jgi:hypothetical protein